MSEQARSAAAAAEVTTSRGRGDEEGVAGRCQEEEEVVQLRHILTLWDLFDRSDGGLTRPERCDRVTHS